MLVMSDPPELAPAAVIDHDAASEPTRFADYYELTKPRLNFMVILTTFGRPGYLRRAMEAHAAGFMVKDAPPETLLDAIRRVHQGLRVVDPDLAAESLALGESPLTGRERDVLLATADGGTVSQIAGRLFLSEGTVRNHLSSVIGKTGAATRADALRIATDRGWI